MIFIAISRWQGSNLQLTYLSPLYLEYHYFIWKKKGPCQGSNSQPEATTDSESDALTTRPSYLDIILTTNFSYIKCFARFYRFAGDFSLPEAVQHKHT